MKYLLLLLFFSSLSFATFAQNKDSVVVVFEITDQDQFAIEGVRVAVSQEDNTQEISSDKLGQAICRIEKFGELKARFWHPDYSRKTILEDIYGNSTLDTLRFKISLTSISTLNLDEVIVTVPGVPQVVYRSKLLSVQDYEILSSTSAVLLAYPKQLKKGSKVLLFDMDKTISDSIEIEGEAIKLVRDYEDHIYLIMKEGCKRIIVSEGKLDAVDISLDHYKRYLAPIIGVSNTKMFFSTYDEYYPAFDYFYWNVYDSTFQKFASVIDKEMMKQYRAEYRYVDHQDDMAVRQKLAVKNLELTTGIDAEALYGRRYFTSSIFYESPFAPMFKMDKYLFLFDYHCDSLKTFNEDGKQISEVGITHDQDGKKKGWKKLVVKDRVKNKIYVAYEKGGFHYLQRVNLSTGELFTPVKLNHRYAEDIQVYNGNVYYVYRPFESYQKKYFWREKLPKK